MPHAIDKATTISVCRKEFFIIYLCLFNEVRSSAQEAPKGIGAIMDISTRIGREEKISMEIAIQDFNSASSYRNKLVLHAIDSGGKPLQASAAAKGLVEDKNVEAILGMETWMEATLVEEVASKAEVPVLSFATPSITPPLMSVRWPFLVKMASNDSLQMKCIASIVGSYGWTRVIVISEDDGYSTHSGTLKLLSDELGVVGSEIEHWLAFPPFSTLFDPNAYVQEELDKLDSKQSRVFILVISSLELAIHVLTQAKHYGLMGKHSVWITTDSFTNLLDAVDPYDMPYVQGVIGIKIHFPESNPSFKDFSVTFRNHFRSIYPKEEKAEPGFYAVRAYDAISTVALALETLRESNSSATRGIVLLENILSRKFDGLSGRVHFEDRELSSSTTYEIVNVVGKTYFTLKYWSGEHGFSDNVIDDERSRKEGRNGSGLGENGTIQVLGPGVHWPGGLKRVPLGWMMPSEGYPLIIGIPGGTTFEKFVKVKDGEQPTGFCIDVFKRAVEYLNYDLPHTLVPYNGSYEDLISQVFFKKFDAVVGDITITANRSDFVEFTQPYIESGLIMVASATQKDNGWLIVKPFNRTLWIVVISAFLYITSVVWFLEHRSNPDFKGPLKSQLGTALQFTSSTIFFAHKDSLRNNLTQVVIFMWLFTVFVVTSSYTASLTSMLTVKRLEPKVTDIDKLRRSNSPVGCYGSSFIRKYLEDVLHFNRENIVIIQSVSEYPEVFRNGTIQASFVERAYARVILQTNLKGYQEVGLDHQFGGFGFVFQKGSPLAGEFSKAILELSEDGTLTEMDKYWFPSVSPSSDTSDKIINKSLDLSNFWALLLVTVVASSIVVVLDIILLFTRSRSTSVVPVGRTSHMDNGLGSSTSSSQSSLPMESLNQRNQRYPPSIPLTESEIPTADCRCSNNRSRVLRIAYSFPGWGARDNGL